MKRPYILVGAGGTGAALFPFLIRYLESWYRNNGGEFDITIIDGKEIGATKLDRQLFFRRQVGNPKATALLEQYEADPSIVIAVPTYLDDDNIVGIEEHSVVLIAADNFPVRARIETRGKQLENITVINGGNELTHGSLQIWIRRDGKDLTPPLSQGHPELLQDDGADPALIRDCQRIAELPGGEQTVMANMLSATVMLNAVRQVLEWENRQRADLPKAELYFDLNTGAMRATDRPGATPHA